MSTVRIKPDRPEQLPIANALWKAGKTVLKEMEGISKKSVATSNPFRFLVGPEKREFTIHSYLVAHQSPALEALVHGRFKEAIDCSVEWDDIDERTFVSFWHYVYTGDYDTPAKEPDPDPPMAAEPEPAMDDERVSSRLATKKEKRAKQATVWDEPIEGDFDFYLYSRKDAEKKRRAKRDVLWDDFQKSWRTDLSVYIKDGTRDIEKRPKDPADIFIHHGRVYVLADRYGITRLMDISFHKLHQALVQYDMSEKKPNDIVALLRFCYAELAPEKLRQLVIHYASCNVEKLWKSEEFQGLLEEYGSLARALVGSMLLRLD